MKISKSKKELARIISENGGWRDGAEFSAIEMHNGDVWFCKEKPEYKVGVGIFSFKDFTGIIEGKFAFPNWHQCILSREEYFHLYPAPDADGWIECNGCEPGIDRDAVVEVIFRDGQIGHKPETVRVWCWTHGACDDDIIAYRLHKPEKAQPQSPVDMAFDIIQKGVKTETKPTIEQLASDYRNAKDYADRKQEEADAAKADAEAKLSELVSAGKVIGLVLSVTEKWPELVITDWRDLRVGDIVKVVGSDNYHWKRLDGLELRITRVGNSESDLVFAPSDGEDWAHRGNTQWIFIRRP